MQPQPVPWGDGTWTHAPEQVIQDGGDLVVTAVEGSDAWRTTSYGFVHDSEHALLQTLPAAGAVEVSFTVDLAEQFDQAGLFLRVSAEHWVKAGETFHRSRLSAPASAAALAPWSTAALTGAPQGDVEALRLRHQAHAPIDCSAEMPCSASHRGRRATGCPAR